MNKKTIKLPIPKEGVVVAKSGVNKIPYVYYFTEIFRNEKGQPDNKRISIGRALVEENLFIPNSNYYKIFETETEDKSGMGSTESDAFISNITKAGNFLLVDKITDELNLKSILKSVFPRNYKSILNIAMFMLNSNKAMHYLDDWCEENYNYDNMVITSQRSSEVFKSISLDDRNGFFRQWISRNEKDEYLAYDVTSLSSYSKNNELVEWGYNRDGEDLPQINIGVFYGEESHMPIYYNNYSGSITDKTFLPFMMQGARELGINISKFVMDKGFYSGRNVEVMLSSGFDFILCIKEDNMIRELIHKHINEVKGPQNYILKYRIYGSNYVHKVGNYNSNIHIFFDSEKAAKQEKNFYPLIEKYEKELNILNKIDKRTAKKYMRFFQINIFEDNSFEYEKDYKKIELARELLGYFACITNDICLTCEEVITIYREKDVIEKHYDNMKNFTDGKRSRTHYTETFEGKLFINFISLIYKSWIELKLKDYLNENNSTTGKVLTELSKVKLITINGKKRLCQPLTKKQKDIYKLFGLTENRINSKIKNL